MSSNKPWERPWSMEEIIENSDKWNLAGDVALLNTLKSFADKLISRSTEINNNLHNLSNNLEETSLQLSIAQNEFQSLRNSQFVESRVYEDDETLPQAENSEKAEDKSEPDRTEDIRGAALKGLQVLEHYFDRIEVSVSDSEDEDIDLPNYVLRPKDLYIDRPLPYVIGSEEWHKNWHVGLEESSSDSETEKVSDKFSESDEDLPINRLQPKIASETSSELDFSPKTEPKPVSSGSDTSFATAASTNRNFAEELAAKLGNVIDEEVNRRPIQKQTNNYLDLFFDEPPPLDENKGLFSGGKGLFDDDDDEYSPPLQSKAESSPKLEEKKTSAGLFDGGESSDDDIFAKKPQIAQSVKPPLFSEEPPALIEKEEKKKPVGGVSIFGGGANLFDRKLLKRQVSSSDEDEEVEKQETVAKKIDLFTDDDNLFKDNNNQVKKINLFDSDEEEIKQETNAKEEQKKKKMSLFDDDEGKEEIKQETEEQKKKKISLFDDDDDLFKNDLFSSNRVPKKRISSGLFDDIEDQNEDLFSDAKPSRNLFEDLMAIPDNKNSINVDTSPEKNSQIMSRSGQSDNLFGDGPGKKNSIFGDLETDKPKPDETKVSKQRPRISLFDSPPPEPDDLFGEGFAFDKETNKTKPENKTESPETNKTKTENKTDSSEINKTKTENKAEFLEINKTKTENKADSPETNKTKTENKAESPEINKTSDTEIPSAIFDVKPPFSSSTPETSASSVMRLFDPSPPPDDDWDAKSETVSISEENESITDLEEVSIQKSLLFSEEPPSLDLIANKESPKKISEITEKFEKQPEDSKAPNVTSPGKLKHNLKINVGALMPGYKPPKREASLESPEDGAGKHETSHSLDTTDNVQVLHSVTKDRARVPSFNRRPSTRRGRKALQNSSIIIEGESSKKEDISSLPETDFFEDKSLKSPSEDLFWSKSSKSPPNEDFFRTKSSEPPPIGSQVSKGISKKNEDISNLPETEDLFEDKSLKSPSEDLFWSKPSKSLSNEDFFRSKSSEPPLIGSQVSQDISTKNEDVSNLPETEDLFEDESLKPPSEDLFWKKSSDHPPQVFNTPSKSSEPPPIGSKASNLPPPQAKSDLFDDEDDDDFFTSKKVTVQPTKSLKKSLFDDDDDNDEDDDIFKSSTVVKKTESKLASERKIPKMSSVKRLENTKPEDDPLSALLK